MKNYLPLGFKKKCYITPEKIILSIEPTLGGSYKGTITREIEKKNVREIDLIEYEVRGFEIIKTPF